MWQTNPKAAYLISHSRPCLKCSGARKTGTASLSSSAIAASEPQPSPAKKPRSRPQKPATALAAADVALPAAVTAAAAAVTATKAVTAAAARQKARQGASQGADGKAKKTKAKKPKAKAAQAEDFGFHRHAQSPVSNPTVVGESGKRKQSTASMAQAQLLMSSNPSQSADGLKSSLAQNASPERALADLPLRDRLHKIQALLLDAGISPAQALLAPQTARAADTLVAQDQQNRWQNANDAHTNTMSLPHDMPVYSSPGRTNVDDTICLISPSPAPACMQQQQLVDPLPLPSDPQQASDCPVQLAISPSTNPQTFDCNSPAAAAPPACQHQQEQQPSLQQQLPQQNTEADDSLRSSVTESSLQCGPSTQIKASAAAQNMSLAEPAGHLASAEKVLRKPVLMSHSDSYPDHQQLLLSAEATRQNKKRTRSDNFMWQALVFICCVHCRHPI